MLKSDISFPENNQKITLDNGINIIFIPIPNYHSVSVGFFLKKGSRDENQNQLGYTHFCEHMLFKSTSSHTSKEIAKIFDEMGGYFNGYTTHEQTVIYNRIPHFYLEENLKLMHEIFHNSSFDESEMETERDVIINEIRAEFEDPQEKVHEYFMKNIFPDNALGLPIIGHEKSIKSVKRDDLLDFYNKKFISNELNIVIAGKVDVETTTKFIKNLDFRTNKVDSEKNILKASQGCANYFFSPLHSEQAHILLGTSKFDNDFETYIKTGMLNAILGESMSSRFFQRIREELGLCYSIYSFFNKFRIENLFGLYMSVIPKNAEKAINAISDVVSILKKKGITNEELLQVKKQKIGEIILNYDILNKRMQRAAQMEIKFGKIYTFDEVINIIEHTTVDDLNRIINDIFIRDNFVIQTLYKKEIKTGELKF